MKDRLLDALTLELTYEPVPPSQVVEGSPSTGLWEADAGDGSEWGVWEMTPGAMSDVEADEMCVIIAGRGTLERTIDGDVTVHELSPGTALRLMDGEHTIWRVHESLRKVYWIPAR